MLTAMAVMLPLLCLHAYTLYSGFRSAEAAASRSVLEESQSAAKAVAELLERSERLLGLIASREDILALDTARCERFLHGFGAVNPIYANITVADRSGQIVCVSVGAPPASAPRLLEREWFRRVLATRDFVLTKPILRGLVVQRPLTLLAVALRDPQGEAIGTLAVSIDLLALSDLLSASAPPAGGSTTLIDGDGIIFARSVHASDWIGHRLPASAQAQRRRARDEVIVARSVDGVEQAFASTAVGKYGLRVSAGMPTQAITAGPLAAVERSAVVAGLTLLFAVSLAIVLARSLARPLARLGANARAWAAGDEGVRADERLPGEFGTLAQEFNRMIEARQASDERLRQTEMRYDDLLDSVDMAVVNLDVDGRLRSCNEAFLRLTGWRRDEVLGAEWIARFLPDEPGRRERVRSALAEGWLPRVDEYEIAARDGGRRLLRWHHSALRADDGTRIGVRGIGEDITERHEAERARQASEAAAAANQAKTEFISRMSHELRTPLNAVLGFSQLLSRSAAPKLDDGERRQLEMIFLAGDQLRALIDDVLDVARIEAGGFAVSPQPLELCALLDRALALCAPQAEAHGVALHRAYAGLPPQWVRSDATRLTQVVLNLMSNGIKYNRPGGRVEVDVRVLADDAAGAPPTLEIVVADTGIGMTPQQLQELFQPFNRLGREHGGIPGAGIGLALSRQLVQLLDGTLQIDSQAERGTVVRVRLPLASAAERAAASGLAAGAAAAPAPVAPGEPAGSVLYIEDNAVNAILVTELLSCWPRVRLEVAPDGETGLRRAQALQPDVMLLDMQLPDMSGLAVMERLRADPATRSIKVMALSASAMPDEVAAARRAGAVAYWTKPIDFERFLQSLASQLPSADPRAGPQRSGESDSERPVPD